MDSFSFIFETEVAKTFVVEFSSNIFIAFDTVSIFKLKFKINKMNAFDAIQKQFRVLQIRAHNLTLNWENVAILFLITLHILMVFVFLAIEASNYDEYFGALFVLFTAQTAIFFYLSFTWQTNNVFKLIDDLNEFVRRRKIHS